MNLSPPPSGVPLSAFKVLSDFLGRTLTEYLVVSPNPSNQRALNKEKPPVTFGMFLERRAADEKIPLSLLRHDLASKLLNGDFPAGTFALRL